MAILTLRICRPQAPVQVNSRRAVPGSDCPGRKIASSCGCMTFDLHLAATISLLAAYPYPASIEATSSSSAAHDTLMVSDLANTFASSYHSSPPSSSLILHRRTAYWPKSFSPDRESSVELLQKHTNKHPHPPNMPPLQRRTTLRQCTMSPPQASHSTKRARS
jgi:hypothetical protein